VVGELDEEILLALRRLDGVTLSFLTHADAESLLMPSSDGDTEFDVVIVGLGAVDDDPRVGTAKTLLRPRGTLVVVATTQDTRPPLEDVRGGRDVDRLKAQLEFAESRRSALVDELFAAEQLLSDAETRGRDVVDEIHAMRRTVSWRVTRPLRWMRSRAAKQ
jgi:hypothetical protein